MTTVGCRAGHTRRTDSIERMNHRGSIDQGIGARFARLGLQRRIMLYVLGGLLIVLAAYSVVSLQAIGQSTDLVFRERLGVARAVAQEIDADLLHLQRELTESADRVGPKLAADQMDAVQAELDAVYEHWSAYDGFDNPCVITLTDPVGTVVWTRPTSDACPASLAQSPALAPIFKSHNESIISEASTESADPGRMWFAVPVNSGTNLLGYLVANVRLVRMSERLVPMLELRRTGYELELIDANGLTVASTVASQIWKPSEHLATVGDLLNQNTSGVVPGFAANSLTGSDSVIAYVPLTAIHWGVIVEEAQDSALELPRMLQTQLFVFGGAVLLVGLLLAWLTTRAVVTPVNALIDATQRIAAGQLDTALDIGGEDEVGRLARAFDDMRVELKQSREKLALWSQELETRVAQRTRELATLVDSSRALTSTLDLDTLFDILTQQVRAVLPASQGGVLYLAGADPDILESRSTFGFDAPLSADARARAASELAARAVAGRRGILSPESPSAFADASVERGPASSLVVPLISKGAPLGALLVCNFEAPKAFGPSDLTMLEALANQAAAAIENARLFSTVQEKEAARAVLLEKVITAQEEERQRVAREIHDELGQLLTRLSLNLQMVEGDLPPRATASFAAMQTLVWQTIEQAHRLVIELRPTLLDELGLEAALREELKERLAPLGVATTLTKVGRLERLPASVEIAVFRIAQEAISNVVRHAHAHSVELALRRDGPVLELTLADDGVGVPTDWQTRKDGHRPVGLLGMEERATLLGGTLAITARRPQGTSVDLRVPLGEEESS